MRRSWSTTAWISPPPHLGSPGRREPSEEEADNLAAALARTSDRRPFSRDAVDEDVLEHLRAAARSNGAYVDFPHGRDKLIVLAVGDRAKIEEDMKKLKLGKVEVRDTDGKVVH